MKLDIRQPMGALFLVFGVVLLVFGLFSDRSIYEKHSLGININLLWGFFLASFGLLMLALARRANK